MTLPKMDIPVGLVEWEVFVPEQYTVHAIDGNVIDRNTFPTAIQAIQATQATQIVSGISGGALAESVTVAASKSGEQANAREVLKAAEPPSQNVINLQRRAAGVLPVRVDVPRAGVSHQFLKPLVVDQETVVSLRYKRR
jgi:hypothetical protein